MEESLRKPGFDAFSNELDPEELSPVILAYLGDAVYELLIRLYMLSHGSKQPDRLHKHTTGLVNASSQTKMLFAIEELLTEEELTVYKRGRNAKKLSHAKNQSIGDYRRATGFEALVGWLYLKKEYSRREELVLHGIEEVRKA